MAFQPTRFIHAFGYPKASWALTPRFHPYQIFADRAVLLSVTLSVTQPSLCAHPLGGVVLYVVRTFLP